MGKIAIITGISGQDGSYLAELLLKKKYKVYGICNPKKKIDFRNVEKIKRKISFKKIDINNYSKIKEIIKRIKPTEFYHLAAQSFINYKFEDEFFKLNPNINGTHYILSAIKKFSPKTKFYFAASSELFGNIKKSPQNEETKFNPRSAYGVSKVAGFYLTKNYREA
jgi:GDPmannose 4,6-dehydratase